MTLSTFLKASMFYAAKLKMFMNGKGSIRYDLRFAKCVMIFLTVKPEMRFKNRGRSL